MDAGADRVARAPVSHRHNHVDAAPSDANRHADAHPTPAHEHLDPGANADPAGADQYADPANCDRDAQAAHGDAQANGDRAAQLCGAPTRCAG